ncbi:MAG: DNA mismatch repair endonuclease MutL [Candidatus Izemoplasmataceae bacterium]
MGSIRQLDINLSNMIAAGEVVENPASVVKELLENAIDAGSTKVRIELKESGLRAIRIIDNGTGMDEADLEMALKRHATSKIKTEHDLHHIASLGFRGEALPSIASVTHMTIESSLNDEPGHFVKVVNGRVVERGTGAARQGTLVEVSDLFYNTPARLKHLRNKHRELSNVQDYVQNIALSHSRIAITLMNDGKTLLATSGDGNTLKILNQIYPTDIIRNMLAFKGSNQYFTIRGYATKPLHTRSSRRHMMVMVNRRMIKEPRLLKAIDEAYRTYLPKHKHPIVYLEVEVDPVLIDVNVHPQKLSVKFTEQPLLESLIQKTIHERLEKASIIPNIRRPKAQDQSSQVSFNDGHHRDEPETEGPSAQDEPSGATPKKERIEETETPYRDDEAGPLDFNDYPEPDENSLPKDRLPELEYIGQLHGTYLMFQNEKGLYIMDQHAAAERIRYELYYDRMRKATPETQSLTVPFEIRLSSDEVTLFEDYRDTLESFGIHAKKVSPTTLSVTTIPSWFRKNLEEDYTETMIRTLIDDEAPKDIGKIIDPLAKDLSCKHSIRANKYLTTDEVQRLLKDLRNAKNPFTCPHGRPTIIHFSVPELETFFKRIQS